MNSSKFNSVKYKSGKKNWYLTAVTYVLIFLIILMAIFFIGILKPSISGFSVYESQPDASSGKDAYLKKDFNTTNYGSDTKILIGKDSAGNDLKGLLEFNVSSIPANSTITSAKLQVNLSYSSSNNNITIKVYRVTSNWTEAGTTWSNRSASETWAVVGGDYSGEFNSLVFSNVSALYNFTITSLVRGWINGSYTNYGLILVSSDAATGDRKELDSSDSSSSSARPRLTVDYTENAAPYIINMSTNSNLSSLKKIGEQVTFNISWLDLEGNNAKAYVCNSSSISPVSGCADKTFCSTSLASTNPIFCSYTITSLENRTTVFYAAVCDSNNCSEANQSYFYMNHVPSILVVQPNSGETVNQSLGDYEIKFNISDLDNDFLFADIYYGETQNSTAHLINSSLNLTDYCTDADSKTSTANPCSYYWNSSGIYGTYYLTIIANDSHESGNDSSDSSFNVRGISDSIAPSIASQWIEEDISSGEQVQIYANITDENIVTAWATVNTSIQTNVTLLNSSALTYNGTWTAAAVGSYEYKVYARDVVGNLNASMSWQNISVRKPNATSQNPYSPSTALPYHTIKVTGELNANDSLRDVYAYLNVPGGFTFLSGYPQNSHIGNFSAGQTRNATWFLSAPLTEAAYSLNITYTDYYSNTWNSTSMSVSVTSAVGGGYDLDISGYPEVQTSNNYYSEAYFKQSGAYSSPDSIKISIYDSLGNLIVGPSDMYLKETGIYNYTYSVPSSQTAGQWETKVNATKSSTSYYTNQFWKLVGALFDVGSITIVSSDISSLNISVLVHNNGTASADLTLSWNLTRTDNNQELHSGGETFAVSGGASVTKYYSPSTSYLGSVKITFLGRYSGTETAGAYSIFSTTSGAVAPPSSPGGGGGGGTGRAIAGAADMAITADRMVYVARNIEKTILVEVNNNGGKQLTNLTLELENLNPSFYTISPTAISSLKVGETKSFQVKFLITDLIEEQPFNYLIRTNEMTEKQEASLTVLSISDYFQKEIDRLTSRVAEVRGRITDQGLGEQMKVCEDLIEIAKSQISNGEYIDARDSIESSDDCIDDIEKQISGMQWTKWLSQIRAWFSSLDTGDIFWIAAAALLVAMIILVFLLIRKVRAKLSILNILGREEKQKPSAKESMSEKYFEEKMKSIREKLSG